MSPSHVLSLKNIKMIDKVVAIALLAWSGALGKNAGSWYENGVVYQIYPRSFQDSDGDGIGDLKGILQHVDYLGELGIDAVWLNPIYPSPNKDFGYDITDYKAIDPVFGSMKDFEDLVSALKNRSINLIMDYVPNHTSDQHPWFKNSSSNVPHYRNYYIWHTPSSNQLAVNSTLSPPNNWISNFNGSMWEYHTGRQEYYLHQFLKYQPDLNYRNPDVINEMTSVLNFWLDKGVEGFRLDAAFALAENETWNNEPYLGGPTYSYDSYNHTMTAEQDLTFDILTLFRRTLDTYTNSSTDKTPKLLMTESYRNNFEDIKRYYGSEQNPIATFPFNFFLITEGNKSTNASQWADIINDWYQNVMPGDWSQANFVLGNHDRHRLASRLTPEYTDIMNILSLILKGTSVIYFGDEIGLQDSFVRRDQGVDPVGINATDADFMTVSRDPERAPIPWTNTNNGGFTNSTPWLPLSSDYWNVNIEAQRTSNVSHLQVFKQMIQLRKSSNMNQRSCEVMALDNVLIVYRVLPDNPTLIAVLNTDNKETTVDLTKSRSSLPPVLAITVKTVNYANIESANNMTSSTVLSNHIYLPPLTGLVLSSYSF